MAKPKVPVDKQRQKLDRYLESKGLLNYQTKGLSADEVARRYQQAGVKVQDKWFNQTYNGGGEPTNPQYAPPTGQEPKPLPETSNFNTQTGAPAQITGYSDQFIDPKTNKQFYGPTYQYQTPTSEGVQVRQSTQAIWLNGNPNDRNVSIADVTGAPKETQTDPTAEDFDWQRLSLDQKRDVLNDPKFSVANVKATGQQGLIASDPMFDLWGKSARGELEWWQAPLYTALSNPKASPIVQGAALTVMTKGKALPIAVPMTLLAYGAQSGNKAIRVTSETLLKPFMVGAQTVEQLSGLKDYLSNNDQHKAAFNKLQELQSGKNWLQANVDAFTDPEIKSALKDYYGSFGFNMERLGNVISDPQLRAAVWEAGKIAYDIKPSQVASHLSLALNALPEGQRKDTAEAVNAILPMMRESNAAWVIGENEPVPVTPGYTLDDAVKRIMDGEPSDMVLEDFRRVYGVTGVASDFLNQSIYDPLNVAPNVVSKFQVGGLEAANERLVNLGVLSEADTARVKINEIKAEVLGETPNMTGTSIPWSEAGRKFKELVQTRITPEQAKYLTPWERAVAGLTADGRIKEIIKPDKVPTFIQTMVTLQPKAKAKLFLQKWANNINLLLDWSAGREVAPRQLVDILKATSKMDMETLKNAGAEFMASPEAYTTIGATRDFIPQLDKTVAAYEAATPNRELFWQVQNILGEEPRKLLNDFLDGDPRNAFERLQERLVTSDVPEAKDMLAEIEAGRLTPESMGKMLEVFKDGDVPLSTQEFLASTLNAFEDHMKDWGKDYFGLKQVGQWEESLRLLKGAQSLLLLDLSPSAIVNDFINERVMMATVGTLGLTPMEKVNTWIRDFGIAPKEAGYGLLGDVAREETGVVESMVRGEGPVSKAATGLNKFRSKLLRSQATSRFNEMHAKQIYYSEAKGYWSRNWVEGKGFDRMPASLEMRLQEYGLEPKTVYQNLRSVFRPEQLELLKRRVTNHDVSVFVDDAAIKLGKDPAQVASMLDQLGVLDDLREKLSKADTTAKRLKALDDINETVMQQATKRDAEHLAGVLDHYKNKVATEKQAGALHAAQDIALEFFDGRMENDRIWDEAWSKAADIEDKKLRNQVLSKAASDASQMWKMRQDRQTALYQALFDGLDMKSEFAVEFTKLLKEEQTTLRKFFEDRNKAVEKLSNSDADSVTRSVKWEEHIKTFNERFAADNAKVIEWQKQRNDLFVKEQGRLFGTNGEAMARAWVDAVMKHTESIHNRIVEFRAFLADPNNMPQQFTSARDWRDAAWRDFKPEYQKMWSERMGADMEGAGNLYKWDENQQTVTQYAEVGKQENIYKASQEDVIRKPRGQLQKPISDAILQEAKRISDVITGGEPGKRTAEAITSSTYPEWYNELQKSTGGRTKLLAVLDKIVKDHGADKGKVVERVKEFLLENIQYGDSATGNPPNLSVLKLMGADDVTLENTLNLFNDQMGTDFSLNEVLNMEGVLPQMETRAERLLSGAGNQRQPAYQQLREKWDTLDPIARDEAIGWILQKTLTDPLSGIETLVAKALSGDKPAGWVEATSDLNALTAINNTWGHDAGNVLIKGIGQIAKAEVEKVGGRAFRVGGDEFTYWFPDEATAKTALDAIDKRVLNTTFDVGGQKRKGFTVSYGIGEDATAADAALYADKARRVELGQRPIKRDTLPPSVQSEMPIFPPGGYDQTSGYMDIGRILTDGYSEEVRPVLDAMRESMKQKENTKSFTGLDAQTQADLNAWLQDTRSKMVTTKRAAKGWADAQRDFATLDYERQYGFDRLLSAGVPYEFFGTRSGANWFTRVLDRPAWISHFVRTQQLHDTYQSQLPERMRNKYYIPMPFLPEWAGGGVFVDPTFQLFPFKQFTQPLDAMKRDNANLANNATYILREWGEDGTISATAAQEALDMKSGKTWERALAEAKLRQGDNANSGADYFSMLLSPALYLTVPYYLATGKKPLNSSWPSGQMPITRLGQGAETAFKGTSLEWAGNVLGLLAKPEQLARKKLNLNEFGEYGDYYIDRQIANMVTEGNIDQKTAQLAMIERKGKTYEDAVMRVRQELMLKVPGMAPLYGAAHGATFDKVVGSLIPSLFPGGLLPPGEMEYKGLKQEYGLAWEAYKNGDKKAISNFFDLHPEYQARLALRRDPAERLNQFLRSEIWDAYGKLGPTDKKSAVAFLGDAFKEFMDASSDTEFSTEQLAIWSKMLSGLVPEVPQTAPAMQAAQQGQIPQINYYDKNTTAVTDEFFRQRTQYHGNYYELEQGYYALPKSQRPGYLLENPALKEYWDWKKQWFDTYPDLQPIFKGQVFKRIDTTTWAPGLLDYVTDYAYAGKKLPKGAYKALEQQWILEGRPYDDMKTWLNSQVVPALMYGQ